MIEQKKQQRPMTEKEQEIKDRKVRIQNQEEELANVVPMPGARRRGARIVKHNLSGLEEEEKKDEINVHSSNGNQRVKDERMSMDIHIIDPTKTNITRNAGNLIYVCIYIYTVLIFENYHLIIIHVYLIFL